MNSRRSFPPSVLAFAALLLASCAPAPTVKAPTSVPDTREGRMSGTWTGKHKEDPATPKEGESSNFLAEQLGGYTLELDADGRFSSDWRGLTKKGTWKLDKDALVLSPTEVLGKSLAESGSDRALFEEDNRLAISPGDSTLTLSAKNKDSQTVIFTKAKG